jgi:hypothetical protein
MDAESLRYRVRIKGNGTEGQFAEIHKAVMATSPNFCNIFCPGLWNRPALLNNRRLDVRRGR